MLPRGKTHVIAVLGGLLASLTPTSSGAAQETAATVRSDDGARYAFLEVTTERATYYRGEPFELTLRFGVEEKFRAESMVQLFRRRLDLPVQLQASWLDDLPGAAALETAVGDETGVGFALDDGTAVARRIANRTVDGRVFQVFEYVRRYRALDVGTLTLPACLLRFAYADEFQDDLLGDRIPIDRRDAFVSAPERTVDVLALPEAGRPASFGGAVGRFELTAEAAPRDLAEGESLVLTLIVRGEGNLAGFDAPRLDDLEGFHVLGLAEELGPDRRTLRYDLAPRTTDVRSIPAIELPYFDPEPPGGYAASRSGPIPILVRPEAGAISGPDAPPAPADVSEAESEPPAEDESPGWIAPVAGGLVVLLVGGSLLRRRARTSRVGTQRAYLVTELRERLADDGADVADAWLHLCARLLDCPEASVVSRDLPARLARVGLPEAMAAQVAELLDALLAPRYGGRPLADARDRALATADELAPHLG